MSSRFPVRKILILAANPQGTSSLRLDVEVRGIQQSLRLSNERDRFEVTSEWAVRTEDLMQLLVSHNPHIVHFLGHGTGDRGLVLEDGRGRSQMVPTRALARLFQQVTSVECVLLNACYSDTQAQAISQFVSVVVGMNQPIGDPAAVCFARGFYTSLGNGGSYEAAYEMGRTAIELEGMSEGATPVLRTRAGRVIDEPFDYAQGAGKGGRDGGKGERVFISYRDEGADKGLAQVFFEAFVAAGYGAFMASKSIRLGEAWRDRINTELRQCDYFLLLLSPLSATSEMVTEEVKRARALKDQRADGQPVIWPIRVQFPLDDPLNYELRGYLQQIQQREWWSEADTPALLDELMALMADRSGSRKDQPDGWQSNLQQNLQPGQRDTYRDISFAEAEAEEPTQSVVQPIVESVDQPPLPVAEPELKREPGGAVQFKTGLYVARPPIETDCFAEIEQPGALIRIKAPRQMGKTSLMARILNHAREQGYQTVPISFQRADSRLFNDLDLLLQWFCSQVGRRLKKLSELRDYWTGESDVGFGSKDKCNAYFEECLLEALDAPLVLALDEVDMVFPHPAVADDFFALVRSWYESARYGDFGSELWENLRLVMVHSTEAYVPLNINQSPFNVGKNVELVEFDLGQVQDLAGRYGLSASASSAEALMALVGGHPYLIRKALYHLRREDMTLNALAEMAATESGIYSDHLRRHLYVLRDYPVLAEAFRQVVSKGKPVEIDAEASFKLESMGLVRLSGNEASPRCEVYRDYFRDHLEG